MIAPVLSFAISENTKLTLEAEYRDSENQLIFGLPAVGTVLPNPNGKIPRDRNIIEPSFKSEYTISGFGYRLEHRLSNNWSLQSAFLARLYRLQANNAFALSLSPDNRTLNRRISTTDFSENTYNFDTNILGKFTTGSIEHQLLFGVDLYRRDNFKSQFFQRAIAPLDLFNPVYGQPLGNVVNRGDNPNKTDALGIYVQDQIKFAENLKLLLGLRFDAFEQINKNNIANTEQEQTGDAFSPRVGIVYQPIPPISLYASYSRSFTPAIGTSFTGSIFQPQRGTQYEVGVKADLSDRLSATLAFYDLTRSNVLTTDNRPGVPPGFSTQTGEQRSKGIELNFAGEILPGWNIIAGYAYIDARIEKDNTFQVGNFLNNVPKNSFNLWTTYEIQTGDLKGLGLGLGFFYVADRQGDLANTFELPSYFRTDAAIFYERGQFRAAVNFRNLFNVNYFDSAASGLRVYPGEPFTVQGTISWQF